MLDFFLLKQTGGNFLLQCNFETSSLKIKIPQFYMNCLQTWSSLQPHTIGDENIVEEYIWNNKHIIIEDKSVYNNTLKNKGILKFNDLLSSNGGFVKAKELKICGFTHAEVFSIMTYIDAVPAEWRKHLKHTKKANLPDNRQKESQLWINGKLTSVTKLKQKHKNESNCC